MGITDPCEVNPRGGKIRDCQLKIEIAQNVALLCSSFVEVAKFKLKTAESDLHFNLCFEIFWLRLKIMEDFNSVVDIAAIIYSSM